MPNRLMKPKTIIIIVITRLFPERFELALQPSVEQWCRQTTIACPVLVSRPWSHSFPVKYWTHVRPMYVNCWSGCLNWYWNSGITELSKKSNKIQFKFRAKIVKIKDYSLRQVSFHCTFRSLEVSGKCISKRNKATQEPTLGGCHTSWLQPIKLNLFFIQTKKKDNWRLFRIINLGGWIEDPHQKY